MRARALSAAVAALLLGPPTAGAAEIDPGADPGTALGAAILAAEPGETIEIPPGSWVLTEGDVLEEKDLTLRGAGEERTTIVPSGGGEAFDDPGVVVEAATVSAPLQPPSDEIEDGSGGGVDTQAQIIALVVTIAIFLFVLELVRRRRLVERYALLWMTAAVALLVLSIWTQGLDVIADLMGIQEPANAIFILAFGVGFLLLLNFSVASSRLSEETKILAQEVARLDQELREERARRAAGSAGAEQAQHGAPVGAEDAPQRR